MTPEDVVWSYAGVRPLYDDGSANASAVTRDYVLEVEDQNGQTPVLSVFGGKITTFRRLAEHALDKLAPYFPAMTAPWTDSASLPGGDLEDADFERFFAALQRRRAWIPADHLRALARRHGTRLDTMLTGCASLADLGQHFGKGLYAREIDWLVEQEWAMSADDILFRRTKFGLHLDAGGRRAVAQYFQEKHATLDGYFMHKRALTGFAFLFGFCSAAFAQDQTSPTTTPAPAPEPRPPKAPMAARPLR